MNVWLSFTTKSTHKILFALKNEAICSLCLNIDQKYFML